MHEGVRIVFGKTGFENVKQMIPTHPTDACHTPSHGAKVPTPITSAIIEMNSGSKAPDAIPIRVVDTINPTQVATHTLRQKRRIRGVKVAAKASSPISTLSK